MATQKPLVILNGQVQQLPAGDSIEGASVTGTTLYAEPVVIANFNSNVVYYEDGEPQVPLFVTTSDGDIVSAGV